MGQGDLVPQRQGCKVHNCDAGVWKLLQQRDLRVKGAGI
jgi:hypothetical protein